MLFFPSRGDLDLLVQILFPHSVQRIGLFPAAVLTGTQYPIRYQESAADYVRMKGDLRMQTNAAEVV